MRGTVTVSARRPTVQWAKRMRLLSAFLLMMISGLVWNSFGLFLVSLEAEFGWSRASISGAYGAFALVNAVTAPLFGYLLGRYDSRRLLTAAALVLAIAFALTSRVETVLQFWLIFGVLAGLGTHCTSSYAIFTVLAGRFRERPATAMSIADAGSGLAAFLGIPVIHWLIVNLGWREAYLLLGVVIGLVAVPLHLLALDRIRKVPKTEGLRRSRGRLLPIPVFAALIVSYFCGSAVYHGLLTQQIALFEERGVADDLSVWLAAVAGLVVFAWRLLSGWLCDLWGPGRVMAIAAVGAAVTFLNLVLVVSTDNGTMLLIYPLMLGIGFGGQQVLLANGVRMVVSLAALAGILSICRFASGAGMAGGPILAGFLHDLTGGYALALVVLAILTIAHFASFAAVTFARREP